MNINSKHLVQLFLSDKSYIKHDVDIFTEDIYSTAFGYTQMLRKNIKDQPALLCSDNSSSYEFLTMKEEKINLMEKKKKFPTICLTCQSSVVWCVHHDVYIFVRPNQ